MSDKSTRLTAKALWFAVLWWRVTRPILQRFVPSCHVPDALTTLQEAMDHLTTHFGTLDPPLGDVLWLRQGEGASRVDMPLDGGNDTLRASTLWDADPDGRLSVRHGDSFVMFIRWDSAGQVHSESIMPYGAAVTRPTSPHHTDQAQLFVQHRLKPVLFERAAFLATNPHFYRP